MTTVNINGCIGTTDASAKLGAEVWVDQTLVIDVPHVTGDIDFFQAIDDAGLNHCLKIVLKNKLQSHTKVDDQGNITQDARLIVKNISFDEIQLEQVFVDQAVYTHNFNGTQTEVQEKFYGEMGCNGTVTLQFDAPVYIWLLENM